MRNTAQRTSDVGSTLRFVAAWALLAAPAWAQKTVVAQVDVWSGPQQVTFQDPASGCRYFGKLAGADAVTGEWVVTIDTETCGSLRRTVAAKVVPGEIVRVGLPRLRAGDTALLYAIGDK